MLYYNQVSTREGVYALNFDGVGNYLQSQTTAQGGLDFVQWDREQPWTFFVELENNTVGTYFFSGNYVDNAAFTGIAIIRTSVQLQIYIRNTTFSSIVVAYSMTDSFSGTIQITYDGSSTAQGIKLYINNVQQGLDIANNSLATSIVGSNQFTVGRLVSSSNLHSTGLLKHLSFVNYVKSSAERTADFNNKKQTVGTGSWLLAPIDPLYKDDGSKQIKTLNTTSIVNEQGYKLNLINYPTPLVKGTNLIKL